MSVPPAPGELQQKSRVLELVLDYWRDVDTNWGSGAHLLFTEDGVFESERMRLAGRAEIKAFYDWRRGRGERVARHLVANPRVHMTGADRATIGYIMTIYAMDGVPVLPVSAPNLICDVTETMVWEDQRWWIAHKHFNTLFKGEVAATVMPPEILAVVRTGDTNAG